MSTGDLRSKAKDVQRVRNHNHKWAKGGMPASGKEPCPHLGYEPCPDCWDKPARRRPVRAHCKSYDTVRKPSRRDCDKTARSADSSAGEEDIKEASAAPEPDADIMYSYDSARGPHGGSQILSVALAQALERFENQETEKLAKEYEFVDGKDGYIADADDDDFEIVDVNLH